MILKLNRYHNHSKQTSVIKNCMEGHIKKYKLSEIAYWYMMFIQEVLQLHATSI